MPRPFFDAHRLPGLTGDVGEAADALERWMRQTYIMLRDSGGAPTHWFIEAQHIPKNLNMATAYKLITLGGTAMKFAHQTGAKSYLVDISVWRKHFLGRGSGFKKDKGTGKYLPGEDPKELAIQQCANYGWYTDQPDAAEACGILDYGLMCLGADIHPRPWRDAALLKGYDR